MTQSIKKHIVKLLRRRPVQSLRALIRASAIHNQRPVVLRPEKIKIVVLAPHMDDEVLGCGGTLARHAQAGADISVVFLTDGRYGSATISALPEIERERMRQELVTTRKDEARRAGEILGVTRIVFLDSEDARLRIDPSVADKLRAILDRERPEVVYLPFFLDGHPDHSAASEILIAATVGARETFECRCYEVWTPLFPNIVVDIDTTIELKKRALRCYGSQLTHTDYVHTGIGLNAYRSSAAGCATMRFVEAFYALPLSDYGKLYRSLRRYL